MKTTGKILRLVMVIVTLTMAYEANAQTGGGYEPTAENLAAREAFVNDRFGVFIHWGLYSMYGHGEWYQYKEDIDYREYQKGMGAFYPGEFDAESWVKFLKSCGVRYITFTTRHHEGFSMWDTKESDFKITNTPFGRDVLKELADACERYGMKLGLYYSHIDWHTPDYPVGKHGKQLGREKKPNWARYYKFMNDQLTELLTRYGRVNCIWFDGMWEHGGEPEPFDWQLDEQYKLIHRLQPACLVINNHHGAVIAGEDVQTWERDLPGENKNGHAGLDVGHLPLETATTMCDETWGYDLREYGKFRSSKELIQLLVRTAAKDANLLLNVGPRPDGKLPEEAKDRLYDIGMWLAANGETIYGTRGGTITDGEHYVSTTKGQHTYIHLIKGGLSELNFETDGKVVSITQFKSDMKIEYKQKGRQVSVKLKYPATATDYILDVQTR